MLDQNPCISHVTENTLFMDAQITFWLQPWNFAMRPRDTLYRARKAVVLCGSSATNSPIFLIISDA